MELRMRRLFALVVGLLLAVAPCALAPAQTEEPAQTPQAGDEWTEPITGMEFVWVPAGCYEMGCGEWAGDECDDDEYPVHEVCVDGFWMGKYEVTWGQWRVVMNPTASRSSEPDNFPARDMSWDEAQSYMWRLELKTLFLFDYRLPTEAEWEYACRSGGLEETYSGSNDVDEVAWYNRNAAVGTHPVGTKLSNGLGLYDMSGNVFEWVQDWYIKDIYSNHSLYNPVNHIESQRRLCRGGSYLFTNISSRCSRRMPTTTNYTGIDLGFRLVIQ